MKLTQQSFRLFCCCTIVLLLFAAGCAGTAPGHRYYGLSPIDQLAAEVALVDRSGIALGVGPVIIPDELKSPQIVTRPAAGRYQYSEFNRWAGLLENDLTRVLGVNLGLLLGTDRIGTYPWQSYFKPDYRIAVEVLRFDGDLSGEVILDARWTIVDAGGTGILASGRSRFRQPVAAPAYESLVRAESLALAELSRTLADAIRHLQQ